MAKKRIATFLGPNVGLSIAGDYAYAYSGNIQDAASGAADIEMLNFTTGTGVINAIVDFDTLHEGADTVYFEIELNGSSVLSIGHDSTNVSRTTEYHLIIPPHTTVVMKWGINAITTTACVLLTGRVYDA